MKGYNTPYGYLGYLPKFGRYFLYATEKEYVEDYRENEMEGGGADE